jgi:DNA primase
MVRGQAQRKGWSLDLLFKAGVLNKRDDGLVDWFHGRLVFPIFSLSGKVVGFTGRVLDDSEPKYLNSPEGVLFRKGDNLYGGFQAKGYIRETVPVLVEGNFDLLSLVDNGLNHVVAPLGTALTPTQAALLRRYNARTTVCFDGDAAGRKAARRAVETLLGAGVEPQVAVLPDRTDPDSYIRAQGKEKLVALLDTAPDWVEFALRERDLSRVAEQRAALGELVGLLKLIEDDATRELYANKIADRFRVDKAVLLRGAGRRGPAGVPEPPRRTLEEKLVGSAIQDAKLTGIARELELVEVVADEKLRQVLGLAMDCCDLTGYNAGLVLDRIPDEEMRKRAAAWTFEDVPFEAEFRSRVMRLRAEWLHRRLKEAHEKGDDAAVEKLTRERTELLQRVARERSDRREN